MDIKEAAQQAMDIQSADNLSGVIRAFSGILTVLWGEAHKLGEGIVWINKHPIAVLFAEKIKSLTGDDFATAYEECEKLAKGK